MFFSRPSASCGQRIRYYANLSSSENLADTRCVISLFLPPTSPLSPNSGSSVRQTQKTNLFRRIADPLSVWLSDGPRSSRCTACRCRSSEWRECSPPQQKNPGHRPGFFFSTNTSVTPCTPSWPCEAPSWWGVCRTSAPRCGRSWRTASPGRRWCRRGWPATEPPPTRPGPSGRSA